MLANFHFHFKRADFCEEHLNSDLKLEPDERSRSRTDLWAVAECRVEGREGAGGR